jgi:sugar O-acyltransferase (sialic acid O-acetyltransferase NeuD family)
MRRSSVIVIGAIGNAIDVAEAIVAAGEMALEGFLDDDAARTGQILAGAPVLGPLTRAGEFAGRLFVNAIGSARSYRGKPALIARLGLPDDRFATVVHPRAWISPSASLGPGVAILANSVINAQAHVGAHSLVLPNCVVGHDSRIEAFATLAAGVVVSGNVRIAECCYLGAGSAVREGVRIGAGALVGMASAVVADAAPGATLIGVPARPIAR